MEWLLNKFEQMKLALQSPPVAPWRILGVVFFSMVLGLGLVNSSLGEQVEVYLARKLEFQIRSALSFDPQISDRIKIFAFDDTTVEFYKARDLTLADWALVIEHINKQKPKAIMFDKLFDIPSDLEYIDEFTRRVSALEADIIGAVFVNQRPIKGRKLLTDSSIPQAGLAMVNRSLQEADSNRDLKKYAGPGGSWSENTYVYGAHPGLLGAFDAVGHIVYWRDGFIQTHIGVEGKRAVPHWSLWAADQFKLGDGEISINGKSLNIDDRNRILVNFLPSDKLYKRTYRIKDVLQFARSDKRLSLIQPDDIVIILPGAYTGSTDFVDTPLGKMPGGYVLTAMVNSILTDKWVHATDLASLGVILGCLLGAMLGVFAQGNRFWSLLGAFVFGSVGLGIVIFLSATVTLPWLFTVSSFTLNAFVLFAERNRIETIKKVRIENELQTARLVQQTFIPTAPVVKPRFSVHSFYQSATECSGDFWNHISLGDHKELVVIGDVMGHGTSAALITAMAYSSSMTLAFEYDNDPDSFSPHNLASKINRVLFQSAEGNIMMTAIMCIFDFKENRLHFTNAGHTQAYLVPNPKLSQEDGRQEGVIRLQNRGNPTGIIQESTYRVSSLPFYPGDKIVLYTDGLVELCDVDGNAYGRKRLIKTLKANGHLRGEDLLDKVIKSFKSHLGTGQVDDDITVVMIEITEAKASADPATQNLEKTA